MVNFALKKLVIIFGVINVQKSTETMMWLYWFTMLIFLYSFVIVSNARIKVMVDSLTRSSTTTYWRVCSTF